MTRWMLVFEDPASGAVWLAKGTPRSWLEDGQTISVANAPVRGGRISFSLRSRLRDGRIEAAVELLPQPLPGPVRLRLRAPTGHRIRSVTLGGMAWTDFDADGETVTLPAAATGRLAMTVSY